MKFMSFVWLTVFFALLPVSAQTPPVAPADTKLAQQMERVENGLLPGLVIKGQGDPHLKIRDRMAFYKVPGLSLAVIDGGQVVWSRSYGVRETGNPAPVTPETLFQAGSISKPVTALAALHLVQQKKLALDEDVNRRLTTWKVPENEFTRETKVTLRELLSHTAGITVRGFDGYATGEPVPTLLQVLNGEKPANSAPLRVERQPGRENRYSGGGFTIAQQLMLDVTRQPFPAFLRQTVFKPFNMQHSTFEQPLPEDWRKNVAVGHRAAGDILPGRWHSYPEMAAAGLWTTPLDLARFVIGLQQLHAGKASTPASPELVRQMMTLQTGGSGLGMGLKGEPKPFRFSHSGSTEGYTCILVGYLEKGQGAVIMTNSDNGSELAMEILRSLAAEYTWPDLRPEEKTLAVVDSKILESYAGTYDFGNGVLFTVTSENGKLYGQPPGRAKAELLPESETVFFANQPGVPSFTFVKNDQGHVTGFVFRRGPSQSQAKRVK
ncbi:MAG: serine hydrolase [Blastocatellia bacterium]|nr:serine hydrolase [Blastocatellia bacterium]